MVNTNLLIFFMLQKILKSLKGSFLAVIAALYWTMFVCGEGGGGHNAVTKFIDFFHVSDHLEQFGRYFIFSKKKWKH